MEFEDFVQPEVGVAAAVVAVVASPEVRRVVRRGAVLGVAGVLMAGDAISSFARGVGRGAQSAASASSGGATSGSGNGSGNGAANGQAATVTVPTVEATSVTEEPASATGEGI